MNPEVNLFIDGKLTPAATGKTFANISPVSEESIGEVADAGPIDAELAISAARRAFDDTDWSTNHKLRIKCLQQLKEGLYAEIDELKKQTAAESGATLGMCAGPHCDAPLSFIEPMIERLESFEWSRDIGIAEGMGMRSRRMVEKEPVGVVAAITPWNVPVELNLGKMLPALATGCTVILKPAPDTPWSATFLGYIVEKHTDIPPGVFNVLTASDPAEVGEILVTDPRVDMVTFTGSTGVGKRIMSLAAGTVKKVGLELGGKSANIILDDANLEVALASALGVCFHAGQGCALQTRMLIPESQKDQIEQMLPSYFSMIEYGDPESDQMMGPVVNKRQYERVQSYIEKGKVEGARVIIGGGADERFDKGYYIKPTVFMDVTSDMAIAQEEIFGPVLVVITYKDDEEAIRIANDTDYGLSGGVWSSDEQRAVSVARRIRTGSMGVNGGNIYSADAPFGGYKQSGLGREKGDEGFEEYLETKTIAIGV
ncbi:MAG: aldehyde dehydrogenase family protein [Pseudomonadales bacterium]|nr:MAG: aldehyde dehydrogenase family protein [Pseudomonadales bacterium]